MPKIIIDAGHGGYDNGATYNGRKEKDDNLALALAVGEILADSGIDVGYTRVEDVYQSPVDKARNANQQAGDYLVSIHRNSSPVPNTYSGVQSLIYTEGSVMAQMAENINQEMEQVGYPNLGTDLRRNLAILRRSSMPAILVEAGFINTDADNALFDQRFTETAQAIADGIIGTLLQTGELEFEPGDDEIKIYRVQTGLFRKRVNAETMAAQLRNMGYSVTIELSGDLYAVKVGEYTSLEEAAQAEQGLRRMGYDTLIVSR